MYEITPKHDFLVGIDSDGCAFDTMELKHKECFIPNTIKHYKLQAVSKYAREAAEFVNLYSKSRGVNRFPALIETLEWLQKRPEVLARQVKIEVPASVVRWIREESKLGNPALELLVNKTGDPELRQALEWSKSVNDDVAKMVEGVPPFPFVRECLMKLAPRADMLVVSATPNAALKAEWEEHDIARYVAAICGQETSSKKQALANAQKYGPGHTLMIGDAPGDYDAAKANNCLFFPINPGNEEDSWRRLHDEGIDRFLSGSFAGDYQQKLLAEFDRVLPSRPILESRLMNTHCDFGLIGLAVMGENLALNVESRGYKVAVFNRTVDKVDQLIEGRAKGKNFVGCRSLKELVEHLRPPRMIMMMVKAGPAVDALIEQLAPLLSPGDILIDGGNTYYADTERRTKDVESKKLLFVGSGVSGGEEGALKGPSLMPGGSIVAWPIIKPIFQAIAAKVGPKGDIPCCEWVGPRGAGHYVKMVHNGIEYGDMQLICEAYLFLKALGLSNDQIYDVFDEWNRGDLESYLIEITRDIFSVKDDLTENAASAGYLVDAIKDEAGAKGTGKWMSQLALDLGVPSTLVTEAVYARSISALKDQRVRASKVLKGPAPRATKLDTKTFIESVRQALYASKICSYAQGFVQLQAAAKEHDWPLNYGDCAMLWRGGCIIRARFLDRIKEAFDADPALENLLLAPYFTDVVHKTQEAWRSVVATAATLGLPTPAFNAALNYYDGYRRERLPANLLQAQRDYFGAHTYRRLDRPGDFHSEWLELRRAPK